MTHDRKIRDPLFWVQAIFILVIAGYLGKMVWFFPRTHWSLKDGGQGSNSNINDTPTIISKDIQHVVLISIDTCRADHLGCYGYSRNTTPNIDALAREGNLFNHVISPVPMTLPAHSSMLTGTIPLYHKVRDNIGYKLDESYTTLAEMMKTNGFTTAAFVGAYVLDSKFGLSQGFDTYDDEIEASDDISSAVNERSADQVTLLANRWLSSHRNDKFFLFLHYYDPHSDYNVHPEFDFRSFIGVQTIGDKYDSEIAFTDHYIGIVINKLKELGLYESTLIIVTADHGESMSNQHDEVGHAYFIYHSTVQVPMIIKIPGVSTSRRFHQTVGLIDILPTICSLTGIEVADHIQGVDLCSYLENRIPASNDRHLYCESLTPTIYGAASLRALVTNQWKYIHTIRPELYNLADDPDEKKNLLEKHPQQGKALKSDLMDLLGKYEDTAAADKIALDPEVIKRLESLGYVSGKINEGTGLQANQGDPKDLIHLVYIFAEFSSFCDSKENDKAYDSYLKLQKERPEFEHPEIYLFLSERAFEAKDYPEAALQLQKSLELDYKSFGVHHFLGEVLTIMSRTDEAIKHFEVALSIKPKSAVTHHQMAIAYATAGKFSQAVQSEKNAIELTAEPGMYQQREKYEKYLRSYLAGKTY
jgi:arylsulfatase A-like enzyme